jgi:hypothetical protein
MAFFLHMSVHGLNEVVSYPSGFPSMRIGIDDLTIDMPSMVSKGKETEIHIRFKNENHPRLNSGSGNFSFIVDGLPVPLCFINGETLLKHVFTIPVIAIYADDFRYTKRVSFFPSWIFFGAPVALILLFLAIRRLRN